MTTRTQSCKVHTRNYEDYINCF